MNDEILNSVKIVGNEMMGTRVFHAPRELVFNMWSDPAHITNWWGPKGFSTTTSKMELKPEGVWRFVMHGPDGRDYQNKIIYIEVVENELLVYKHAGVEDTEDIKFHVTVKFEDYGGQTKLTMKSVFESVEELERVNREFGAFEGLKQTLERLGEYLAKN